MPARTPPRGALVGGRNLVLAILLIAGLLGHIGPVHAQDEETGGIGGTGISGEETGGVGGTGMRRIPIVGYGPIQRFGSVFINGREYAVNPRTLVTMDGQPAPVAALGIGDMALVHGVAIGPHGGVARAIAVWQSIIGPVTAIAPDRTSFTVLGQRVLMPDKALTVRPGEVVGISGQRQPNGTWVASRVIPLAATSRFRLESTVTAVGRNSVSFHGLRLSARPAVLAGILTGARVIADGVISGGIPRVTSLIPSPLRLGSPGTLVEVRNYFLSAGSGRLVAADGMVAVGARGAPLSGTEPVDVVGHVLASGNIEVSEVRVAMPDLPDEGVRGDESRIATPAHEDGGHQAGEPAEQANRPGATEAPDSVEPPEVAEPNEPTEPEIEPPEIQVPEPQTPEPDIDAPEVEPPTDR